MFSAILARSSRLLWSLVFAISLASAATVLSLSIVSCGGENQEPCHAGDPEYSLSGLQACDRGLRFAVLQGSCVNDSRRIAEVDPWANWALRNQEVLAIDEPINWVSRMGTHNAFNAWQDSYSFPNQWWSMTDQLRLGSRHFELDLHWFNDAVRLCHGDAEHRVCGKGDRLYVYGMREIRTWLSAERNQILTIDFEDRSEGHDTEVNGPIETYFRSLAFTPEMRAALPDGRMPTFREMIDADKRLLIFDPQDQHGAEWLHPNLAFSFPSGQLVVGEFPNATAAPENVRFNPVNRDCWTGLLTNNPHPDTGVPRGFNVLQREFRNLFAWVAEDRVFGPSGSEVTHRVVERAVRCGVAVLFLDDYATGSLFSNTTPEDFRHWSGIWSWEPGDSGNRGDAAVLKGQKQTGASGSWNRWVSRSTSELHPFLCGRPRSESGGDPTTWVDWLGNEWRVTQGIGTWSEGGLRCFEEFGETWVFSVPVNGYKNVQASLMAEGRGDVWLNYNDIKDEDAWVINKRPLADAGLDQTLECISPAGAVARLDGSASSDPENDALRYRWTGESVFTPDPVRELTLPLGAHSFTLVVDDHFSGVHNDQTLVTVQDSVGPTIHTAVPSSATLWPPNGKMHPVSIDVSATDSCSPNVNCRVVAVASNEPNQSRGSSAKNGPDAEISGLLSVALRAERLGSNRNGRIYTMTMRCTDATGNATEKTVTVTVPHDQR
jgi:hypothetical protein